MIFYLIFPGRFYPPVPCGTEREGEEGGGEELQEDNQEDKGEENQVCFKTLI